MCGICGLVRPGAPVSDQEILPMRDMLAHRGPDRAGVWTGVGAGLGHRRLSIIDLDSRADQPLASENGSLHLVFNGEIYNFQALRPDLEARGHVFRTASDTEVIIHAYEEFGLDCLSRFRGMFAFALWDADRRRLFAARDRLGKKPLFYCQRGETLYFGSEIKAILVHPDIPREVDFEALGYFLSLNYTPAPHTLFAGIRQLEPGQYLLFSQGRLEIHDYWDLEYPPEPDRPPEPAILDTFTDQLREAIRLRLIADVPVGAFLSGGLDSTAVVALAAPQYPGRLQTFSIGFAEKSYDERPAARLVATRFGTEHHELEVRPQVADVLPTLVWHAEEPTADSSMLPVYYLARFAARRVKVVLTGDGADEILAGYETYQAHYLMRALNRLPGGVQRFLQRAAAALPVSHRKVSLDFKLKRLVAALGQDLDYAHYSWRQIWSPEAAQELLPGLRLGRAYRLYSQWLRRCTAVDSLDRLLYADTRFYLPNDMLVKVDRMTMAHGLEARTPFLDHRLVEWAAGLPPRFKLRFFMLKKFLLRRLLTGLVPARLRWQGKKGFNVPVGPWIRGPLRDFFADTLALLRHTGWIDPAVLDRTLQQHVRGQVDFSHHLWGLTVLALWWRTFIQGDLPRSFPSGLSPELPT